MFHRQRLVTLGLRLAIFSQSLVLLSLFRQGLVVLEFRLVLLNQGFVLVELGLVVRHQRLVVLGFLTPPGSPEPPCAEVLELRFVLFHQGLVVPGFLRHRLVVLERRRLGLYLRLVDLHCFAQLYPVRIVALLFRQIHGPAAYGRGAQADQNGYHQGLATRCQHSRSPRHLDALILG